MASTKCPSSLGVQRIARVVAVLALAIVIGACADRPSPDGAGARSNEPPYPVLLTDAAERQEAALADWTKLNTERGITNAPAPALQPVTSTIRGLPTMAGTPLYLPKLGPTPILSEEAIRDSLRRFITSASKLLGAEPQQLSLVQRTDLADGTKKAHYEQRPFRYPLRGGYGELDITFATDRRILQITSTCIPDVELLQRSAVGIRPKWTAEKVPEQLLGRTFTYSDGNGVQQSLTIAKDEVLMVRELVIYPIPRSGNPSVLEFHLCWEIALGKAADSPLIYLDAVTEDLISVRPASK